MTTLFLDIDGVLNNKPSREKYGQIADFHSAIYANRPFERHRINFDPNCVQNVIKLLYTFDLDLVISSNWRFGGVTSDHFKQLFALYDLFYNDINMIDPSLEENKPLKRSQIIGKYLYDNKIDDFIMIDDTISHYNSYCDKLILTNDDVGFDDDAYVRAHALLESITHKA